MTNVVCSPAANAPLTLWNQISLIRVLVFTTKVIKKAIRRDGKSPDLKVNDTGKQLQTKGLMED